METSGFVDWPRVGDFGLLFFAYVLPSSVYVLLQLPMLISGVRNKVWVLRVLRWLLVAAAIVSWITCACVLVGSLLYASGAFGDELKQLATQSSAAASFNQHYRYCEAWSRQTDHGLSPVLKAVEEPTALDEIVGEFDCDSYVATWCLNAMKNQKYDLLQDYDGVSPFVALEQQGGRISSEYWAIVFSILSALTGVLLVASADSLRIVANSAHLYR